MIISSYNPRCFGNELRNRAFLARFLLKKHDLMPLFCKKSVNKIIRFIRPPYRRSNFKTYIYVDAFNLHYGALEGRPYRWLNVLELCKQLLPYNQIIYLKNRVFT